MSLPYGVWKESHGRVLVRINHDRIRYAYDFERGLLGRDEALQMGAAVYDCLADHSESDPNYSDRRHHKNRDDRPPVATLPAPVRKQILVAIPEHQAKNDDRAIQLFLDDEV